MTTMIALIGASAALGALSLALLSTLSAYLRYRGMRVVTCPETNATAAVELDAKHAALAAGLREPALRLRQCSRWPERQDCGQSCLAQIRSAPEDCLVRTILTKWYRGQSCVLCRKPLGETNWLDRKPALMNAERRTFEWPEVPAEHLPHVLSTHWPVCWSCHIAETFRREHPELVVYRPGRRDHMGVYRG